MPPNQDKAQCTKYLSCVFSLMWKDRFAFIPLYKRFRPLRAHFSLLGYKNGRVLGSTLSNLLRLFRSRSILGFSPFSWYYGLFQAHNYSSWKKSLLDVTFQYIILSTFNLYFTFYFLFLFLLILYITFFFMNSLYYLFPMRKQIHIIYIYIHTY